MYKEDLALNNLQWLICHKTKLNYNKLSHSLTHSHTQPSQLELYHMLTASLLKGKTPTTTKECPGYDTKLYLM